MSYFFNHQKQYVIFLILLGAALFLRIFLYQGPSAADDMIYFSVVEKLLAGKDVGETITTAGHWGARTGMVFPLWGVMKFAGVSEAASMIYPLVLSAATMVLIYFSGFNLFGPAPALIALASYALLPLDVHYAGIMYPDGPVVFFSFLSLYLLFLVSGSTKFSVWAPLLAGISLGLGYCIRETSILLFIIVPLLFVPAKNKVAYCKSVVLFGIGFALVLACEMLLFWFLTDNLFARFQILTQKTQVLTPHQYSFIPRFHSYFWDGPILLFATYWIAPLLIPLVLIAAPFAFLWERQHTDQRKENGKILWLAILALAVLLFFIYAPVIGFTKPLERDERYYLIVMPLFALLFGVMVDHVFRSGKLWKKFAIFTLVINLILSLFALGCIVNKNSIGLTEIHAFIHATPAAKYLLPEALAPALRLKVGGATESEKITSYRYSDNPILPVQGLSDQAYLFYIPYLHRIQPDWTGPMHWPAERYVLWKVLHTESSLSCRLLQQVRLLDALPEFFSKRVCVSPDVHVYTFRQTTTSFSGHD